MSSSASGAPAPYSLPVPPPHQEGAPRKPPGRAMPTGAPPWGIAGSLAVLAVFALSQLGAALGISLLLRTFRGLAGAGSGYGLAVKLGLPATVAASHLMAWLSIYLLVVRWHHAPAIVALRLRRTPMRPVLLALLGGVIVQLLAGSLLWVFPPPPDYVPPLREFLLLGAWAIVLLFLFAVVMAPLLEEVMFRGLLFPALRRRFAFPFSAFVVTVLFTAMHLGQSGAYWPPLVGIALCGWFLARWRERTDSLWPPIAFHMSFNLTALAPLIVLQLLGYPIDQQLALG